MIRRGLFAGALIACLTLPCLAADQSDFAQFFNSKEKIQEAIAWKKAADQGSGSAALELGLMLWEEGTDEARAQAVILFKAAAAKGAPSARLFATFYDRESGSALQDNPERLMATLTEFAKAGDPVAQGALASNYNRAEPGQPDFKQAAHWFNVVIANESIPASSVNLSRMVRTTKAQAQYSLGVMFLKGLGTAPDLQKAIDHYEKADALGDSSALGQLREALYADKRNRKNLELATTMTLKQAAKGEVRAMVKLGDDYFDGIGRPRNLAEAGKWYLRSGEEFNAANQLGKMYLDGLGLPKDINAAVKYTKLAANRGNSESEFRLGEFYFEGVGVKQDYVEAAKWYTKDRSGPSKSALAKMHALGLGVPTDLQQAVTLYREALESGHFAAYRELLALEPALLASGRWPGTGRPVVATREEYLRFNTELMLRSLGKERPYASIKKHCEWLENGYPAEKALPAPRQSLAHIEGFSTCVWRQGHLPSAQTIKAIQSTGSRDFETLALLEDFEEADHPFTHRDRADNYTAILNAIRPPGPDFYNDRFSGIGKGMHFDNMELKCFDEWWKYKANRSLSNERDARTCFTSESKRLSTMKAEDALSAWNLLTPGEKLVIGANFEKVIAKNQIWFASTDHVFADWRRTEAEYAAKAAAELKEEQRIERAERRERLEFEAAMREAGIEADKRAAREKREFYRDLNESILRAGRQVEQMGREYRESMIPQGRAVLYLDDDEGQIDKKSSASRTDSKEAGQKSSQSTTKVPEKSSNAVSKSSEADGRQSSVQSTGSDRTNLKGNPSQSGKPENQSGSKVESNPTGATGTAAERTTGPARTITLTKMPDPLEKSPQQLERMALT